MLKNISMVLVLFVGYLLILLTASAASKTQPVPEKMPWTLREHYTFSAGPLRLDYAKDNGEWRIKVYEEDSESARRTPQLILNDVGFAIHFVNGTVLTQDMLGFGGETIMTREAGVSELLGDCVDYTIRFVPRDGILVEHEFRTFRNWSFILLTIRVSNQGTAPVEITKISSAIIPSGHFVGITEKASVNIGNMVFRGAFPIYSGDGPGTSVRIYDPVRNIGLLFAQLPSGLSKCRWSSLSGSTSLAGSFDSMYEPSLLLPPGATIESDRLFIGYGMSPAFMESHYMYLLADLCKPALMEDVPRCWVTVPDTESLSVLRAEAGNALGAGVRHALIHGNWESRPGSLEGGMPNYPKNMSEAAKTLRDAGVLPGITIDPLLSQGGNNAWTAHSSDGQQWVNLNAQEGRAFVVSRMRKVIGMGFSFLVIEPSRIPDDVLKEFGMTRAQADAYAFAAAREAASRTKTAIVPSTMARMVASRDALLQGASTVMCLRERNIATAAIRLQFAGTTRFDEETLLALRLWSGPIEFLGAPPRSLHEVLSSVLSRPVLMMHPQDVYNTPPLVWLSGYSSFLKVATGESIVAFSGSLPWDISLTENFSIVQGTPILWHFRENRISICPEPRIVASPGLSVFGYIYNLEHPVFAGIPTDPVLGLTRIKKCLWNAEKRVLSGEIDYNNNGKSQAYFHIPTKYVLSIATWNGKSIRLESTGPWISIPVDGTGGVFELGFNLR